MTIIGIGYKKRSGKDAIAEHLGTYGYHRVAFADKLKAVAKVMFNWTDAHFEEPLKERVDPFWGFSPRKGLQLLGTEAGRQVFGNDIWVKHVNRHIAEVNEEYGRRLNWVIPDVRFPDEIKAVKGWGGVVWKVNRPQIMLGYDGHESETALDDYRDWDEVIVNDGTLADLYGRVDDLI